jgi:soluble lytic murein transglycosylase
MWHGKHRSKISFLDAALPQWCRVLVTNTLQFAGLLLRAKMSSETVRVMKKSVLCRAVALGVLLCLSTALVPLNPVLITSQAVAASGEQALSYAMRGDFIQAGELAEQSGDPAATKLIELLYLRDHWDKAGYSRIMNFLNAAPNWPLAETLSKLAEKSLYENQESPQLVLQHFERRKPKTTHGILALARAHQQSGDGEAARKWLNHAWMKTDIDANFEQQVVREFGSMLSGEVHKRRMWAFVLAQQPGGAIRNAKRLSAEHQRAAKVAQALIRGTAGADRQYGSLSGNMQAAPAMKYALARFYRKQKKFDRARNILATVPGDEYAMIDAEAFWTERRIIARRSVGIYQQPHWRTAYRIASQHGLTSGEDALEAEFVSGWIALRYLKDTDRAMAHFARLQTLATTRTDKSRAGYWIGRTHAAAGRKSDARSAYKTAGQFGTLYYGQLAREQLGLGDEPKKVNSGEFSAAAKARVDRDEVVRAFRLMRRVDGDRQLHIFLPAIAKRFNSVEELNAAASMMHDTGGTTMALRFAKAVGQNGVDIDAWSYPLRGLPDWKTIGKPVEKALVYGLSRQESEFNPTAGSKVGAQGLMHLMPGTARIVAKQYRLPYAPSKLKGDPAYNVKLGAAHLADLVEDFNGSYVLTLVAYNAGPGRATEWVEAYGDPRGGQVDPIDWVESIPFQETRQYVQKVMQNLHVYRSRLAPHTVRPMSADLKRGAPADLTVASTEALGDNDRTAESGCGGTSIASLIRDC